MAEWDSALFGPPPTPIPEPAHPDSKFRPVRIKHYIKASVVIGDSEPQDHLLLAVVSWYLPHTNKNVVGKPAQIWCYNKFESGGVHSFVPVRYLKCRCASSISTIMDETVLVVVPLSE